MLPTEEEQREYDSLALQSLPLADPRDPEAVTRTAQETLKRTSRMRELSSRTTVKAVTLTAVGRDFVAYTEEGDRSDRVTAQRIWKITGPTAQLSEKSDPTTILADERASSSAKFLGALHAGERVVLRSERLDRGTDVFVGMEQELKDKLPTAEERQEYSQLEAAEAEAGIFPTLRGGLDGLDVARKQRQEQSDRRSRLAVLKIKMEYLPVTLTEVGEDYIAFESGEGVVTYLPLHRLGTVTRRVAPAAEATPLAP